MERMTDKCLVIGLFVDDPAPAPAKAAVVTDEEVGSAPAEPEKVEVEAPVMEAEAVEPDQVPRRRGRPRKVID